jgi:hypothetical protein
MALFLVVLTAVVYGFIMKYVMKNVFVSNNKPVAAKARASMETDSRDLVPVYDR